MRDARKMTNEGLLQGVRGCFMDRGFIRLPEELYELAGRVRIMEELCEAVDHLNPDWSWRPGAIALDAYRAMKGEQDANPD